MDSFYPVPCKFKLTSHARRRISFKSSESSVGTEAQTNNEDTPAEEKEIKPSETTSSAKASSQSIDRELKKNNLILIQIPYSTVLGGVAIFLRKNHALNPMNISWLWMPLTSFRSGHQYALCSSKTAGTFAPRASTAQKNPAVPGTTLYSVFEVQGYLSMLMGGVLSFNLVFPSNEPDIWRLMGMWSIWMFTIPSLRARDCSKEEKEALNYLFLLVPLINVILPFFWKSFSLVWSADTLAFFVMYAWKMKWLQKLE